MMADRLADHNADDGASGYNSPAVDGNVSIGVAVLVSRFLLGFLMREAGKYVCV